MNIQFFPAIILMLTAGLGIPYMAAMNAHLGQRLESPTGAVIILCFVATSTATLSLLFAQNPNWSALKNTPPIYLMSGLLFLYYITAITYAGPVIGIGNAVILVLFGQLIAAALIDHSGSFSMPVIKLSWQRSLGLFFIATGIILTASPYLLDNQN